MEDNFASGRIRDSYNRLVGPQVIPNILYKYAVPERVDILLQKRIRFTQPCFLNDPFEFKPGMPVPGPEGLGHFEKKFAGLHEGDFREKSRLCGVLSLSEKGD